MRERIALITGAAGYIGSAVARCLIGRGLAVRAMVRNEDQARDLARLGAQIALADLTDEDSVRRAVVGADRIIHIAAVFRRGAVQDREFEQVNVGGTRTLLDCACAAGVRRFIHCSTVGVHGDVAGLNADENAPFNPGDSYQRTKLEGEQLVRSYFKSGRIRGVIIRPAMVFGPNDLRTLKLFRMIANGSFFYVGTGTASVHFVDVRDLAHTFCVALEREDLNDQVYIIAGETALPLRDLARLIASLYGVREPWMRVPVKAMHLAGSICESLCAPFGIDPPIFRRRVDFFTKNRAFNIDKARRELKFTPSQNLLGELQDIVSSYDAVGSIPFAPDRHPSVMVRSLDGKIEFWNEQAEATYGWSRDRAVGSISHELLSTQFSGDLDQINGELVGSGKWRGRLGHQRSDGSTISVNSLWQILPRSIRGTSVAEINHRFKTSDGIFRRKRIFLSAA